MALTYGFYNSLNGDRKYDAEQMGRIFDGIINDGVYQSIDDAMMVKASSGMTVSVGLGRAWFNHTWTLIDALYLVTLDDSELALNRYDAVVLEINSDNNTRANSIQVVKGTPALEPAKPTLTNTEKVHQYPLAYVYIAAKATEISQSNITNAVGTSETPFVAGVLEHIDTSKLTTQWATEFEEMITEKEADFNTLLAELKEQISQATSQTIIDKSVTRAKLADDALYSPIKRWSGNRSFVADDLGKTLWPTYSSSEVTYTLTLDAAASALFTDGAELAIAQMMEYNHVKVSFSGIRVVVQGEGFVSDKVNSKTAVASLEQGGMIALKKMSTDSDGTYGDLWLLTGSADIS